MLIAILVFSGVISSAFGTKDTENIKDISARIQGGYQRVPRDNLDERSRLLASSEGEASGSGRVSHIGTSASEDMQAYHSVADGAFLPEFLGREEQPAIVYNPVS
ncbi:hypothetical protein B566_EDAN001419 [Ephemera danica]|nr:hypothetical protein B566_EDAN001419 [Ephemera danica]